MTLDNLVQNLEERKLQRKETLNKFDLLWLNHYLKLRNLVDEHEGAFEVVKRMLYKEDMNFHKWVIRQKTYESRGELAKWQIALLNDVNFIWHSDTAVQKEEKWYRFYNELKEIYEQTGEAKPPANNRKLINWIGAQRKAKIGKYRKQMPIEKIQLLNAINFEWSNEIKSRKKQEWEADFAALVAFATPMRLLLKS